MDKSKLATGTHTDEDTEFDGRMDEARKRYELEKLSLLQRQIAKLRNRKRLVTQLLAAAAVVAYIVYRFTSEHYSGATTTFLAGIVGAVGATITAVFQSQIDDLISERDTIQAKNRVKSELQSNALITPEADYFDKLVKINLENLAAYYELVKAQTDKSFRASLTVASFGAFMILLGLALGFFQSDASTKISYIATGAGILTEFIAGVFFWLYSQTVRQLRGYHDSLLAVQNILLSFKLVAETQEPKQKSEMVSLMCHSLLDKRFSFLAPSTEVEVATATKKQNGDKS